MNKAKLVWSGLLNAAGTVIYIFLVSLLMFNGEKIFGGEPGVVGIIGLLSLFVLSATIVATLMLGRPVLWYANGAKAEAIKLFLYSLIWLLGFTVVFLILMATVFKTTGTV